jgi:hypothetical protein
MSSEASDSEGIPEDARWDMFGVVLGILQNAGHDLDRFTDEELRRATELAYDASVRALTGGAVRPGFLQKNGSGGYTKASTTNERSHTNHEPTGIALPSHAVGDDARRAG